MLEAPLEDGVGDVIAKAQKGLGLADDELCRRAKSSPDLLRAIKAGGSLDSDALQRLAHALDLDATGLRRLGSGVGPVPLEPVAGLNIFPAPYPEGHSVNSYLVWDPETINGVCIDAGGDCEALLQFAAEREIRVQMILLTHGHETHRRGLDLLVGRLCAQCFVDKLESFAGAMTFEAGHNFRAGKLLIGTRPTPGHSRGSDSFVVSGLSRLLVFTGDALFAGSIGTPNYSYAEALSSVCKEILTLPLDTIICPGHGPLTTVAEERWHNPFFPELRTAQQTLAA